MCIHAFAGIGCKARAVHEYGRGVRFNGLHLHPPAEQWDPDLFIPLTTQQAEELISI